MLWQRWLLFIVIPGVMLVVGAATLIRYLTTLWHARWFRATAIGHDRTETGDGPNFRTRFAWDESGQNREALDEYGFGRPAHRVGEDVWISVSEQQPELARVYRVWPVWLMLAITVAGAVFLGLGISRL
jgi:hypothetical protein